VRECTAATLPQDSSHAASATRSFTPRASLTMNRGASSQRGGRNANVSRLMTGALTNRARPGNNQGLTESHARGNLGRAGSTINGNLALNINRAGAMNAINGNFSLNASPVGNGSAVDNGYGTQAIRPVGRIFRIRHWQF
jgi:hypothetical protein